MLDISREIVVGYAKERERERDKVVKKGRKTRRIVGARVYVLIRCYRVKAPWPTYTRCVAGRVTRLSNVLR